MAKFSLSDYTVDKLGLFGLSHAFKLCHIPFLVYKDVYGALALEGSSGTGKTTIASRLGKLNELSTGGKVGVYSADKARYEDFIGCPIPNLETRQMDMFVMPNSVAQTETVVIDEINRAGYENQEKWMSLIATRRIDSLETKCKYLFTAMNPVMSEANDHYEGVQPLDKALGERMIGIVSIPPYGQMKPEDRKQIIKATFNQVVWEPTQELVEMHTAYVQKARELYEQYKVELFDIVSDYVDTIQADLRKETRGALSIEARRAQYIFVNVIANYALDSVVGNPKLEQSALSGLTMSFPNRLWEQEINAIQLDQAHQKAKTHLLVTGGKKSTVNNKNLAFAFTEIQEAADAKASREQISKLIIQSSPDTITDPAGYYIYTYAVVEGLKSRSVTKPAKQTVMKEQEFAKLEKSYDEILKSETHKKFDTVCEELKQNKYTKLPATFKIPPYFMIDADEELEENIMGILRMPLGSYALTLAELPGVVVRSGAELVMLMESLVESVGTMTNVREKYSN